MKKVLTIILIAFFIVLALVISSASYLSVSNSTGEESITPISTTH